MMQGCSVNIMSSHYVFATLDGVFTILYRSFATSHGASFMMIIMFTCQTYRLKYYKFLFQLDFCLQLKHQTRGAATDISIGK
jgi:hypothetical protein